MQSGIYINGFNANDRHGQEEKKGLGLEQTLFAWSTF